MKSSIIFLGLILQISVQAAIPQQPIVTNYKKLWTDSPFTRKPVIEGPVVDMKNPLEDYALGGVSKLADGYRVTLLNKKDPSDKVIIKPGRKSDFKVINVDYPEIGWRDTVVTLEANGKRGTVEFEDKLLSVKAAPRAAAKASPQQTGRKPVLPPQLQTQDGARKPRPRVVRPPNPRGGR